MDEIMEDLLTKHCSCATENRIVLEAVSICPDCFTFYSTSAYKIPGGKLREVLRRVDDVMKELGIEREEAIALRQPPRKLDITDLAQEGP